MRWWRRVKVFVVGLCLLAAPAGASPAGYVYVLEPATGCETCEPRVVVFDGGTTRLVTRIPLQASYTPVGIALSRDGAHLYVSSHLGGTARLTVIDGRHHVALATYGAVTAGHLAVAADDSAVYIRNGTTLSRWDTATHTVTATAAILNGGGVEFNSATNTVLIPGYGTTGIDPAWVTAHDPVTLIEVQRRTLATGAGALSVSPDGARVHVVRERPAIGAPLSLTTLDAVALTVMGDIQIGASAGAVAPAYAPSRGTNYVGGRAVLIEIPDGGSAASIPVPSALVTAVAVPPLQKHAFFTSAAFDATGFTGVQAMDLDARQVVSAYRFVQPPGYSLMRSTPPGAASCTYRIDRAEASMDRNGQTLTGTAGVTIAVATDCAWSATTPDAWLHVSVPTGIGAGSVQVTADANDSYVGVRLGEVIIGGQVLTVRQAGSESQPAFGVVDTPVDNAVVSGAIPVTGWAIDDVAVRGVEIYRDPLPGEPQVLIKLGDATFVNGARPDVEAIFAGYPDRSRAGWGYQLLTNMLPGGDRTYRLHAWARDLEGHASLLGSRTITVQNATATTPFGAIDTPGQGATVSGTILNWGWALTPQPAGIPTDGSTIDVIIDGLVVGHPTYGLDRADIAALFPGYANTNSAVGYFTIDTTTLTNGVHTIAWVVRDNMGRAQGIGSRYFTVENP